ncbi:MAG: hypothetical protein HYW88_00210 [Candidatus Sungbacteria bacterium]|nr:hypothetical protein [Candidatus Sungbacteria bacterium]
MKRASFFIIGGLTFVGILLLMRRESQAGRENQGRSEDDQHQRKESWGVGA